MKKRVLAGLLAAGMVLGACSGNQPANNTPATQAPANTEAAKTEAAQAETPTEAASQEIVDLKWIAVGSAMPLNYDDWRANTNEYLADAIGVNIDVEIVPWGNWGDRRNIIVSSGEYFDILFTDSGRYPTESKMGVFTDIEGILKSNASDLYKYIPEDYWDAVRVDGTIYSVPTYKDSSATNYFVWDKDLAEANGIDYNNITTLQDLPAALSTLKDATGQNTFFLDKDGVSMIAYPRYDGMGAELTPLGVRFDDQSRTVVNIFDQAEVLADLETIHGMYNNGIINADAPTTAENPAYRMCFVAQGWSGAARTTWGPNNGMEAVAIQTGDTVVSNSTVRGSLNGVYASAKNPVKAVEFLQLINLDSWVRDAFYYGLEGSNFEYTSDGKVNKLNTDWSMAGYTQGTFFNVSQLASDEINQWDEVKALNAAAKGSVLLGFDLDTSAFETELANCRVVWEKYKSELLTGSKEPNALIATMNAELEASGFSKIVEAAQSQIDAAFK